MNTSLKIHLYCLLFFEYLPNLKALIFSLILTPFNFIACSIASALTGINPDWYALPTINIFDKIESPNILLAILLEGKKIISVRYMSYQEAEENGLDNRPVSFKLDSGEIVVVQSYDEGNNGGSLCIIKKGKVSILPTI